MSAPAELHLGPRGKLSALVKIAVTRSRPGPWPRWAPAAATLAKTSGAQAEATDMSPLPRASVLRVRSPPSSLSHRRETVEDIREPEIGTEVLYVPVLQPNCRKTHHVAHFLEQLGVEQHLVDKKWTRNAPFFWSMTL